ncbi:MAG: hypothetical protein ACR2G4_02260 [Pyrinomonadaceae bacterium]
MPTYEHFQEVKKAVPLPEHDKVGVCLTCRFWQVEERRSEVITPRLALCVQEDLKPYALIVSGASGCNKWQEKQEIEPEAKAYAKRGEEE